MNKEKESLLKARTKALKAAEDKAEELAFENRILKNNNYVLLQKNRILTEIIKNVQALTDANTYGNPEIRLKKIKELVATANNRTNS